MNTDKIKSALYAIAQLRSEHAAAKETVTRIEAAFAEAGLALVPPAKTDAVAPVETTIGPWPPARPATKTTQAKPIAVKDVRPRSVQAHLLDCFDGVSHSVDWLLGKAGGTRSQLQGNLSELKRKGLIVRVRRGIWRRA